MPPKRSPQISIGSKKKPSAPKPTIPTKKDGKETVAKLPKRPKTSNTRPEIPNQPLYRKGTDERKKHDQEIDELLSKNVLSRLIAFMEWLEENPKKRKEMEMKPAFHYCEMLYKSETKLADLSDNPVKRSTISTFVDENAPSGLSKKSKKNKEDLVDNLINVQHSKLLNESIQSKIDESRDCLNRDDLITASECIFELDILIDQLEDPKVKDSAQAIQMGLVDKYNEMAAKKNEVIRRTSSVDMEDSLVRSKKITVKKGATDSDHIPDLGRDVEISDDDDNHSVSLGDASDDDELEIEETFDQEL